MERVDLAIQRIFTLQGKTLKLANYSDSNTIMVNGREIPNTNWHENPYPQDDEWIWQFSQWGWIEDFARVYVGNIAIGNMMQAELYARECIDLITDFIQKEPVGSAYTWRTLDSSMRISRIISIGENLRYSTYFTGEFCFLLLRFLADHGRFIADFHKTQNNNVITESNALLEVCAYFPEFTPTETWENIALNTLNLGSSNIFYLNGASWLCINTEITSTIIPKRLGVTF